MGFFSYMGEILWVFLTFMEVFPIPEPNMVQGRGMGYLSECPLCPAPQFMGKDQLYKGGILFTDKL